MKNMEFNLNKLLEFLNNDPYKEALLICATPVKSSTLNRIKSGSYVPSPRLGHAIMAVITNFKEARKHA